MLFSLILIHVNIIYTSTYTCVCVTMWYLRRPVSSVCVSLEQRFHCWLRVWNDKRPISQMITTPTPTSLGALVSVCVRTMWWSAGGPSFPFSYRWVWRLSKHLMRSMCKHLTRPQPDTSSIIQSNNNVSRVNNLPMATHLEIWSAHLSRM